MRKASLRSAIWRAGILAALFAGACGDRRQLSLFAPALEGPDAGANGPDGVDSGDHDSDRGRRCYDAYDCTDERPFCEANEDRCVECRTSDDCGRNESCRFEDHACVPTCFDEGDCAGSGRPICAVSAGVCVECAGPGDCRDSEPFCNLRSGRCVECLDHRSCADRLCNPVYFQCVDCLDDGDCGDAQECVRGECQR